MYSRQLHDEDVLFYVKTKCKLQWKGNSRESIMCKKVIKWQNICTTSSRGDIKCLILWCLHFSVMFTGCKITEIDAIMIMLFVEGGFGLKWH